MYRGKDISDPTGGGADSAIMGQTDLGTGTDNHMRGERIVGGQGRQGRGRAMKI